MASIQDVLATLAEKEAELQGQLTAIRTAISALGGSVASAAPAAPAVATAAPVVAKPAPTGAKRGRKPKSALVAAAVAAPAAKPAKVAKAAKESKTGKGGRPPKEVTLVDQYADAKSWNQKVVWALSKAEKLTADQITEHLHKFETSYEFAALKTMVSSTASTLAKKGGINAVRNGRGFEYSLKG
jgi:hypothetical protein